MKKLGHWPKVINNQSFGPRASMWQQVAGPPYFWPTMNLRNQLPIVLVILAMVGCFAKRAEPTPHAEATAQPTVELTEQDVAPPSELALLMRHMAAHADSAKAAIARGGSLPPFPTEINTLFTAKPTDGMHIDAITFPTFGTDYQAKVKALYKTSKKNRTQAYNALVQSCANCHGTHCPGPLMRIKKMYAPVHD